MREVTLQPRPEAPGLVFGGPVLDDTRRRQPPAQTRGVGGPPRWTPGLRVLNLVFSPLPFPM